MQPTEKNDNQDEIKVEDLDYPEALTRDVPNNDEHAFTTANSRDHSNDETGIKADQKQRPVNNNKIEVMQPDAGQAILIQLGVFNNRSNAEKAMSIFKNKGLPVTIVQHSNSDGDIVYRVVVGPYKNSDDAVEVISKLSNQNIKYLIKRVEQ